MVLRAQAVKCSLFGIAPLNSNLFKYSFKEDYSAIRKFVGAQAVAIFNQLKAGTVGFSDNIQGEPEIMEQFALVTLQVTFCLINLKTVEYHAQHLYFVINRFVDGETDSVNIQAGRMNVARITKNLKIELPELREIRRKAHTAAEPWFVGKRFKPKYGPAEVESGCIQYASVLITHVIHPNHLYVQIEDQDLPLYNQMMDDLQLEFREATKQSPSFCSSPAVGTYHLKPNNFYLKFYFKLFIFYVFFSFRTSLCC